MTKEIEIRYQEDFRISKEDKVKISDLLSICFPDFDYYGRSYFKQLPHYRLLAYDGHMLVGHLGIDYRVMNLNQNPVNVMGVNELCILPEYQSQGIGKELLSQLNQLALKYKDNVDFIFLVSDTPKYYENIGFKTTKLEISWLKIDQHNNLGVGQEKIEDASFLIKEISGKKWEDGILDMLGYMY